MSESVLSVYESRRRPAKPVESGLEGVAGLLLQKHDEADGVVRLSSKG